MIMIMTTTMMMTRYCKDHDELSSSLNLFYLAICGKCRSKHKKVMDKSRKWLKLDPDEEEECDPHDSAAAYGLRNR